ncbi:selenium metabolism-associated LysR family transcriptional regulator [Calderihabitans maritimus]|uniref:Transcriptional regulator, LysR family n=1 Tax=Calderihabitans maritimus TaxID=1246530 RepID=A0A1Z5HR61_9FIRM|nr:selenium metabolism-associated LysR family transcriptional regulator [Calderihabitans maritimus]GAW92022.1 transcriptional regulator, LysR family [Calderihabitans maritimus]
MNLNQLELFCEVARLKSFSKAAKLLHITQPAVSLQIQNLEEYYGAKLFERTAQGVILTSAGRVVYEYARRLLEIHQQMERELDRVFGVEKDELVIGASSIIGNHALPCSIWAFQEKYPQVKLKVEVGNTKLIIQKVIEQQVELGLVEGSTELPGQKGLVTKKIATDEVVVIVPNKGFWAQKEEITIKELMKERFIVREKGSGVREALERALENQGIKLSELNVVSEMSSLEGIKAAVEAGFAISICCRQGVQKDIRRGTLRAIPIKELPIQIDYYLLYMKNKFLKPVAKRFIRFIAPETLEFC